MTTTASRTKAEAKEAAKSLTPEERDKIALDYAVASSTEYTPVGGTEPVTLNLATARRYFAKPTRSGKMPSDELITEFLMLCKARRLNPWLGECYLTGFDSDKGAQFSIITAYAALAKRAELHPQYDGMRWGIIVSVDGKVEEREGAFHLEHELLVGAWAIAYRKDRSVHQTTRIRRSDFDKKRSMWTTMPAWMIGKCARAAALREVFPCEAGELYIEEEREVLPRAIEETERQRKEAKPATKPSVTMSDLTRSPETPAERQLKAAKEFELDVRRCMTVDDVNDARERWLERTSNEEEFDRINLACDKRIQTLLASQEKVVVGTGGELFDHHPNAAEA